MYFAGRERPISLSLSQIEYVLNTDTYFVFFLIMALLNSKLDMMKINNIKKNTSETNF